jgi:UDP-N-acetylmuramyl pentapeptide phosphotransferase/UDP-N-acetylglucosamine-1-phosphate transferase
MSIYFMLALMAISFIATVALTALFISNKSPVKILDHPNERSLHAVPVPRTGGIAIMLMYYCTCVVALIYQGAGGWFYGYITGLLLVTGISILDDFIPQSVKKRLFVQVISTLIFISVLMMSESVFSRLTLPILIPGTIFILFYVIWMTNLYNFMDGMDGFAGGMTVFGFGCYTLVGYMASDHLFFLASAVLAASALGFLVFNFPPARIFMGDTGSSTIGFTVGAFSIWAHLAGYMHILLSILLFSPFIFDATITLSKRIIRKERFWLPHKTHYYQRLVEKGLGHRKTVLLEYGLMLICSLLALTASGLDQSIILSIFALAFILYGLLAYSLDIYLQEKN